MSVSNITTAKQMSAGKRRDARLSGGSEMSKFDLRDTLNGIVVRDANFSEFLVAMKKFGMLAAKSN